MGNGYFRMTTLCYLRKDNCYLMLLRNKKEKDENQGKWIGIGGKLEDGESPDECMIREVKEETGLTVTGYQFKGIITFINDQWENEHMMLYEANRFSGTLQEDCPEGELRWIPFDSLMELPMWEGDKVFLSEMLQGKERIQMKLVYAGDQLRKVENYGD